MQDAANAAFDALAAAYSTDGRHYHTLDHIAALLRLLDAEAHLFEDPRAIALAIFFHDAVYDIGRRDNEHQSALMAASTLSRLGVQADLRMKVVDAIEATAHGNHASPPASPDIARFLDLDLAILAAPAAAYDAYAAAIRREYAVVPEAGYRKGRAAVLRMFEGRTRLYLCDDHHASWDGWARGNLQRELAGLAQT